MGVAPMMFSGVPAAKLKVEAESLQSFKKRVDGILKELESSAASKTKVAAQDVPRSSFGGNFSEADSLFSQYTRVHTLLTQLSQTLSNQIEAMGIAVQGAKNGFENLEDDVRQRFWEIHTSTEERYTEQGQREQERQQRENMRTGDGGDAPADAGPGTGKESGGFK